LERPRPLVHLVVTIEGRVTGEHRLDEATVIGRDQSCDIQIDHQIVSRRHLQVTFEGDRWWITNLSSSNGTFRGSKRVTRIPLDRQVTLSLGNGGPVVSFAVEGGHHGAHPHERRRYRAIIGVIVALLIVAVAYNVYVTIQTRDQRALAQEIFYNIKSVQLDIARTESTLAAQGRSSAAVLARSRAQRQQLERNYDRFLSELGFYTGNMAPDEKLIYRIVRIFGESELAMPPDFVPEVRRYITRWRSTNRFRNAVLTARKRDYHREIAAAMLAQGLPPQFFYLALQESDFDAYAVGPATRIGYAKGPWMFMPETAMTYGLKIGSLFQLPRPDPADERHDFSKSTVAAAKYLKFIYSTDAQASGLLVMASYNWGENRVIRLVRTLPENPRDRNFWKLLLKYRAQVPQQTYDYVFSIVSAAVIGEDPRSFGFDFDNPLEHLESGETTTQ
jgi:hypothetical protein